MKNQGVYNTLVVVLLAVGIKGGADHDVIQVKHPFVVKHNLGRSMAVGNTHQQHQQQRGGYSTTSRNLRDANYPSNCFSCTHDSHLGSSGYGSGGSSSSYSSQNSYGSGGNLKGMTYYSNPQSSSSRQEFRREEKFVNGQPIYEYEHERKYKDGQLVQENKIERDENDFGVTQISPSASGAGAGSYSNSQSWNTGYNYGQASQGSGQISQNFREEVERLRQQLHSSQTGFSGQPSYGSSGSSHRSETHSQTHYVNGKPILIKNEEKKYEDGRLVHEHTEKKTAEDLGTAHLVDQYDSTGALISGGSTGGYQQRREHHYEERVKGSSYYPSSSKHGQARWESTHVQSGGYAPVSSSSHSSTTSQPSGSQYNPSYQHQNQYNPGQQRVSASQYSNNNYYSSTNNKGDIISSSYPYSGSSRQSSTYNSQNNRGSTYPSYSRTVSTQSGQNYSQGSINSPTYNRPYRPSPLPTTGSSSTPYIQESHESSSSQHSSQRPSSGSHSTSYSQTKYPSSVPSQNHENLEETYVQSPSISSQSTYSTQVNQNSISNNDKYYNQYSPRQQGSPSQVTGSQSRNTGSSYNRQNYGSSSSLTGQQLQQETSQNSESNIQHLRQYNPVGIPGVISGPQVSYNSPDYNNKGRYDISPEEDLGLPAFPDGDLEVDSSLIPTLPTIDYEVDSGDLQPYHGLLTIDYEVDSSDLPPVSPDEYDKYHGSNSIDNYDEQESTGNQNTGISTGYSHSSGYYNSTHTIYGTPINRPVYDYSGSASTSSSGQGYPTSSGSGSSYHYYNESRTQSSASGEQGSYPQVSTSFSPDCTQISGGCGTLGSVQSSSRRSETKTSKRYVNGKLIGITHYERIYENGKLVHENETQQGIEELTPQDLAKYGIDQLDLDYSSYQPSSYSQRQEVKQEKKFINGQQVYDLHHERQYEDGQLVHDNRTELNENDLLGESGQSTGQIASGYGYNQYGGAGRHEVRQSQHMQQQVTSETHPGAVGRSSQARQVKDTTRVITRPIYTTRRQETRSQQEFVNGQPVYDLTHERRYHNGSLVYENRTELNEKDLGTDGHYDALHQIMSGNTLNTATQSSTGSGSYSTNGYPSGSQSGVQQTHGTSQTVSGQQTYGASQSVSGGQQTYGASQSVSGGQQTHHTSGSVSEVHQVSQKSSSGSNIEATNLLGGGLLSGGSGSGRARTTILGGSHGLGLAQGGGSSSSSHHSSSSSYESSKGSSSSGSNIEATNLLGGGLLSGGSGSGRARTTILGGSHGLGIAQGGGGSSSSSHHTSSGSYESSKGSSGCLSCVLIGGGAGSSSSSGGYSATLSGGAGTGAGAGGSYSERREMNLEEHYEDGQLVHGKEEDRHFQDGQLVKENRRHYSGAPGQAGSAAALHSSSRGAGHSSGGAGHSSSSHSRSASSWSSQSSSSSSPGDLGYDLKMTVRGHETGGCETQPCQNGGTCIAGLRGPLCVCQFGFKGTRCEQAYCPKRFCRYGGTCDVSGGRQVCACKPGFSGDRCEKRSRKQG